MGRGNTDLTSNAYDQHLQSRASSSRSARQELAQRSHERRNAHDANGVGYHFGLGDKVVKVNSREDFKHELDKRGLMLHSDVKKNLRGVSKHEKGRK